MIKIYGTVRNCDMFFAWEYFGGRGRWGRWGKGEGRGGVVGSREGERLWGWESKWYV